MSTGDMAALISAADRAREVAEGRDPALELLVGDRDRRGVPRPRGAQRGRGAAADRRAVPARRRPDAARRRRCSAWPGTARSGPRSSTARRRSSRGSIRTYRDASAVVALIYPLAARAHLDLRRGRWSQAVAEAAESLALARADRPDRAPLVQHGHAGARARAPRPRGGHPRGAHGRVRDDRADAGATPSPRTRSRRSGHLELSLGRVTEAAAALEPLVGLTARLGSPSPRSSSGGPT